MAGSDQQTADDDLDTLRQRVQASETERAKAIQERDEARQRAQEEVDNRVRADEVAITNAIAAAETESVALQNEYAEALARNDTAAAAEVNTKMVDVRLRLGNYQGQKTRLESWKKEQVAAAEVASKDPLARFTPRTREWLQKHPEVMQDSKRMARATAAHYDALAEGLVYESDEYFKFVEGRVSPAATATARQGVDEDGSRSTAAVVLDPEKEERVERQREAQPQLDDTDRAAPGTRQAPRLDRNQDRPGTVRLTQSEQEAAVYSFPHLKRDEAIREYARNKAELIREGRLT